MQPIIRIRAPFFGIFFCSFFDLSHAQPLDIRGRVVQGGGAPIPDATAELKVRGTSVKTGADGSFILNGSSSVAPDMARTAGPASEPSFPVWRIDGRISTNPGSYAGRGMVGMVSGSAYRGSAAAKQAAVVDTLRIRKAGYRDFIAPIENYAAGNLGDLALSPASDYGEICARQRIERTSEGAQVTVCEALFDQPPRVHLPAATSSTAYAGMTRDSFVTPAGEKYAHASSGAADPEMKRHASALYEITIRNGMVASYTPAILFEEALFMAPLMGKTFDGLISKRTAADRYELKPSLPIRLQILAEPFTGGSPSALAYRVKTAIVNRDKPVTASDGTCMPALSSYGSQAPFEAGAEVLMPVGRYASMHTFGDEELVFELYVNGTSKGNMMSARWFFTPLDLVQNPLALSGSYAGVGHGTPGFIPMLELNLASGGGAACTGRTD